MLLGLRADRVKVPRHTPEGEFYRDADGHDIALDSRWDDVAGADFGPDDSLETWPRPYRSVWRPAVCREDFNPAGLPKLPPTRLEHPGAVPAPTDRQGTPSPDVVGHPAGGVPSS